MSDRYILVGQTPTPCDDLLEWGRWMEGAPRRVRLTQVGEWFVSTVFLGLDHRFGEGPPILFETMAYRPVPPYCPVHFPGPPMLRLEVDREWHDDVQARCSTWLQAEAQHERVVEGLRQADDGTWRAIQQIEPEPLPEELLPGGNLKEAP